MKRKDVTKTKGPIEKKSGFHYHPGSISRLDAELSPEEQIEQSKDWLGSNQCPRCGGKIITTPDGRQVCENDGLVWSEDLKKKYGD